MTDQGPDPTTGDPSDQSPCAEHGPSASRLEAGHQATRRDPSSIGYRR